MKIAMIGHKRIPSREGGIEIVVEELSKRMTALGHSVTAYNRASRHVAGKTYDTGKHIHNMDGVRIRWIPTPNNRKLNAIVYSFFATCAALCGGYDVLHFHAEGPAAMVPLAKLFGKKCVVTIHGLDWQRAKWGGFATKFLRFGEKAAAKYADEIIVLSKNVQQYFSDTYGRKTTYIPNGITKPDYRDDCAIANKYGLKRNGYILYLGRIVPEKGIHYLIDAYGALQTEKALVIAGGISHSADYADALKKQAAKYQNILFTDFVQGELLESLYANAYIYVLPSDLEGMPISLLEAMSYGNCCLTSDIPECTEVCKNNAVYFKKSDVSDLKQKLSMLLQNKTLVEQYRSTAEEFILSAHNWDDITASTLALYKKL